MQHAPGFQASPLKENSPRRNQILALSGGGYRGLYTAGFLAQCENAYGRSCGQQFGLVAGTSIGALLAAGLACGVPASMLVEKMKAHGPKIFARRWAHGARRLLYSAPFDSRPVEAAIVDVLGREVAETPLSKINVPLLITAVRATTWKPAVFSSKGLNGREASGVTLKDAVLASAAAPTYFPVWRIGHEDYVDGGLIANAPDIAALVAAIKHLNFTTTSTYMLSVGTVSAREGLPLNRNVIRPGILEWLRTRELVQMTMAAQEMLTIDQARTLLGGRYTRVDGKPTRDQAIVLKEMDRAHDQSTAALLSLARESFEEYRAKPNGLDDCFAI